MPDPYDALKKAKTIERQPGLVEQAIEFLVGGLGLSGVPVPIATGPAHAIGDTRAARLGEAVAMLAGVPVAGTVKKGIRAFHGSPHDFDKFSLANVGTGEGAQAYGHGLYFAENEAVARQYRDDLGKVVPSFGAQPTRTAAESMAHNILSRMPRSVAGDEANLQRAIRTVDEWADAGVFKGQNEGRAILDVKRAIADNINKPLSTSNAGRMYEVNINADPETLLDWDAPLSQQSAAVRGRLAGVPYDVSALGGNEATGGETMRRMAQNEGGHPVAAQTLRHAGIPGLKYLDQGSRAAGEGSRNYVIFDADLVEIMRKYGLLPPLAAGLSREPEAR